MIAALTLLAATTAITPPVPVAMPFWIVAEDYPPFAAVNRWQGKVSVRLDVGENGRVTACAVLGSSGHDVLDQLTCSLMRRRGRFQPARDAIGQTVSGNYESAFEWVLPKPGTDRSIALSVTPQGAECRFADNLGGQLKSVACGILVGNLVSHRVRLPITLTAEVLADDIER